VAILECIDQLFLRRFLNDIAHLLGVTTPLHSRSSAQNPYLNLVYEWHRRPSRTFIIFILEMNANDDSVEHIQIREFDVKDIVQSPTVLCTFNKGSRTQYFISFWSIKTPEKFRLLHNGQRRSPSFSIQLLSLPIHNIQCAP
jgi:hypothetical protein